MEFAGLLPTGRQFKEPAATLVELKDAEGLAHTAIQFDPGQFEDPQLGITVELVLSFLEYPMVRGLVELSHHDLASGTFVYPTGPTWTVRELLRMHRDLDAVMGPRAALEIAWLGGQILVEAAETGPQQGCFSHGSLSPWRIGIRPDGQLQVFGYGLPPVQLVQHRGDPRLPIHPDSVRYASPERLTGQPETLSSDLFSLAAILYEVSTGEHLYDGDDIGVIGQGILSGEVPSLVGIPKRMAEILSACLTFDPDARISAPAFLDGIGGLMEEATGGQTLAEILQERVGVTQSDPRRAIPLVSTQTGAYTPADLRTLAADDEAGDDQAEGDDHGEIRWGRVSRERKPVAAEPGADPPLAEPRRRRRRTADPSPPQEDAPRRRRRRRLDPSATAAAPPSDSSGPPTETPRQRRARRVSSGLSTSGPRSALVDTPDSLEHESDDVAPEDPPTPDADPTPPEDPIAAHDGPEDEAAANDPDADHDDEGEDDDTAAGDAPEDAASDDDASASPDADSDAPGDAADNDAPDDGPAGNDRSAPPPSPSDDAVPRGTGDPVPSSPDLDPPGDRDVPDANDPSDDATPTGPAVRADLPEKGKPERTPRRPRLTRSGTTAAKSRRRRRRTDAPAEPTDSD